MFVDRNCMFHYHEVNGTITSPGNHGNDAQYQNKKLICGWTIETSHRIADFLIDFINFNTQGGYRCTDYVIIYQLDGDNAWKKVRAMQPFRDHRVDDYQILWLFKKHREHVHLFGLLAIATLDPRASFAYATSVMRERRSFYWRLLK